MVSKRRILGEEGGEDRRRKLSCNLKRMLMLIHCDLKKIGPSYRNHLSTRGQGYIQEGSNINPGDGIHQLHVLGELLSHW